MDKNYFDPNSPVRIAEQLGIDEENQSEQEEQSESGEEIRIITSEEIEAQINAVHMPQWKNGKMQLPLDFEASRQLYHEGYLNVIDLMAFYRKGRTTIYRWLKRADAEAEAREIKRQERAAKRAEKRAAKKAAEAEKARQDANKDDKTSD